MTVRVTRDELANVLKNIEGMGKRHVVIGVPADKTPRKGEPIGNAQLAYIHENGSPVRNIPPRPFLKPGVKASRQDCLRVLRQGAKAGFRDPAAIEKALNSAGLLAQASVKNRIVSQEGFQALKPATIAVRKRKGAKGEKALIRTGQLLNSITYVVRDRK